MTQAARLALVLATLCGVSACVKAQARTPAPPPPQLEVPAPPARVVIPVTVHVPEPPPAPDPDDPAETRPPAAAGAPPTRPPGRPATPPGQPAPTPVLQATSNPAAIEQKARELVATARQNLARVDRAKLVPNAQGQYDTAVRFIRMADGALAVKNFLWAQQLAESAAALAGALVKGSGRQSYPLLPGPA